MNFPFFASFIILCLVLMRVLKNQRKIEENNVKSFWARELEANNVRRKSLDNLEYITIPIDSLPLDTLPEDANIQDFIATIKMLSEKTIVNLTGYTNTDLKLEYGTANINLLTEYDQNYTLMASTLQRWADALYAQGYKDEAVTIMEFALSTRTDTSHTYYLLAEYYRDHQQPEKIQHLLEVADTIPSFHKKTIVRTLQESYL